MSILTKTLVGGLLTAGCGCSYWVHEKSLLLPKSQRGNFFLRMGEVAKAIIIARQIKDPYTASHHICTVATMSSKESVAGRRRELIEKEEHYIKESYCKLAIEKILNGGTSLPPPVFARPIVSWMVEFSGPLDNMHDLDARRKILEGNYVRCNLKILVDGIDSGRSMETLLTGTKDPKERNKLPNMLGQYILKGSKEEVFLV